MFAGIFCGGVLGIVLWDLVTLVGLARGMLFREAFTCFP
jgi:hypothetical protein